MQAVMQLECGMQLGFKKGREFGDGQDVDGWQSRLLGLSRGKESMVIP